MLCFKVSLSLLVGVDLRCPYEPLNLCVLCCLLGVRLLRIKDMEFPNTPIIIIINNRERKPWKLFVQISPARVRPSAIRKVQPNQQWMAGFGGAVNHILGTSFGQRPTFWATLAYLLGLPSMLSPLVLLRSSGITYVNTIARDSWQYMFRDYSAMNISPSYTYARNAIGMNIRTFPSKVAGNQF